MTASRAGSLVGPPDVTVHVYTKPAMAQPPRALRIAAALPRQRLGSSGNRHLDLGDV